MRALLDLVLPPRCPGCRELLAGAGPFCRRCRETFVELPAAHCPRCCEPDVAGLCPHCRSRPAAFERATVPYLYGGALSEAVHRFKYEDRPHYARALIEVSFGAVQEDLAWCTLLAPVSLHAARLKQRGYDQALLLARELGRRGERPVEARAVRRARETAPQVGRDRDGRERNVEGAFEADAAKVRGQRVLLVDDVLTTGATMSAAAAALRDAGAEAVRAFALARAP